MNVDKEIARLRQLHQFQERPSWHFIWLKMAELMAERSHDARTKVGCILVKNNQLISSGYNGIVSSIDHHCLPNLEGSDNPLESKYSWMIHAEKNALLLAAKMGHCTNGCMAYITAEPCIVCYQDLIQAGIERIIIPEEPVYNPSVVQTKHHKKQIEIIKQLSKNIVEIQKV